MAKLCPDLEAVPEAASIVGRILLGYPELEFSLCSCVGAALGDTDNIMRAIFRARGEETRIGIADALMRSKYTERKLSGPYERMLGALRHSKLIRNQYAHCHWYCTEDGVLRFFDLDQTARSSAVNAAVLKMCPIDVPLLRRQEEFLEYTLDLLLYLRDAYSGRTPPVHTLPAQLELPPLHILQD